MDIVELLDTENKLMADRWEGGSSFLPATPCFLCTPETSRQYASSFLRPSMGKFTLFALSRMHFLPPVLPDFGLALISVFLFLHGQFKGICLITEQRSKLEGSMCLSHRACVPQSVSLPLECDGVQSMCPTVRTRSDWMLPRGLERRDLLNF